MDVFARSIKPSEIHGIAATQAHIAMRRVERLLGGVRYRFPGRDRLYDRLREVIREEIELEVSKNGN